MWGALRLALPPMFGQAVSWSPLMSGNDAGCIVTTYADDVVLIAEEEDKMRNMWID